MVSNINFRDGVRRAARPEDYHMMDGTTFLSSVEEQLDNEESLNIIVETDDVLLVPYYRLATMEFEL